MNLSANIHITGTKKNRAKVLTNIAVKMPELEGAEEIADFLKVKELITWCCNEHHTNYNSTTPELRETKITVVTAEIYKYLKTGASFTTERNVT